MKKSIETQLGLQRADDKNFLDGLPQLRYPFRRQIRLVNSADLTEEFPLQLIEEKVVFSSRIYHPTSTEQSISCILFLRTNNLSHRKISYIALPSPTKKPAQYYKKASHTLYSHPPTTILNATTTTLTDRPPYPSLNTPLSGPNHTSAIFLVPLPSFG
ncbi:hypothetical protein M501DRAFT_283541 [Patellaria atrata CBS 101060]|uniref:Uncharacterized protein n=1 Tax=Patellaria atrata CBS 101060 TaxID=1346257 RepID=A0A9P4S4N4_9PEZI|nr:hypothetical protein M501DRAFT_283541 [Patellaria atrata CBS 101060]